ncbi:MAG TPA: hypothetical protein VFQ44_01975 [Streptosporangiaceae bacterium]|nr:hypothetical protein [Streptosporangiaceae bacterium]
MIERTAIPLAGYANAVITKHFPELAAEGDDIFVTIRNPMTVPPKELTSIGRKAAKTANEDNDDGQDDDAAEGTYGIFARLIIRCHAYDSSAIDEDGHMRVLKAPLTAGDVAALPWPIFQWLGEELGKLSPQTPTASQEDGTSKT